MRRLVILAVAILAMPIAAQSTLVIVSDSDCDIAMAELLASVTEAEIVQVEWGQFNEETIEEVIQSDPDTIYIIGGGMAVVEEIQEVLEDMGFSIFRIAGEDRAETSLELYRTFKEHFNTDFAVLVIDTNRYSINRGKQMAIKSGVPLFFCDTSEIDYMLTEINALDIEEVKIITSNRQTDLRSTCEKRFTEAGERLEVIEIAEDNEEMIALARECESLLLLAQEAFENGSYLLCLQYLIDVETLLIELEEGTS
jgi:putative cell wall-binding protein